MLEEDFLSVYDKFVLEFFRRIFEMVREREGSLSAMEAFSVEVIHELHEPTIGQFADFLNISQSNATYKVNSLIKKGYIEKQNSSTDRREYHLILADKYYRYTGLMRNYVSDVTRRIEENFSKEDVAKFASMLRKISDELMDPQTSEK
jgi:DNA-binding MarR family transcriptional regulator